MPGELTADEYCRDGISLAGLLNFAQTLAHLITPEMTTSDVCCAVIKPRTTAPGWRCVAECVDPRPDRRWYKHEYVNSTTGETRLCGFSLSDGAPPGTTSLCQLYREVTI
jgi:hypothetical protein